MITKEEFINFIKEFQQFEKAIDRLEEAISGKKYGCNLFESDWYQAVDKMFNTFVESHFTENGCDLIFWWVFEDVDHIITHDIGPNLFGDTEITYDVNNIEDFWNYLLIYKEDYFKNV